MRSTPPLLTDPMPFSSSSVFDPLDLAYWLISKSQHLDGDDEPFDALRVQKLLYFSEGWFLAHYDCRLWTESFEAWSRGPALPSIWKHFQDHPEELVSPPDHFDSLSLLQRFSSFFDEEAVGLLEDIFETYTAMSPSTVECLSQDVAWRQARGPIEPEVRCHTPLSKETIQADFKAQLFEMGLADEIDESEDPEASYMDNNSCRPGVSF